MTKYESISLWIAAAEALGALAIPVVLAVASFIVSRHFQAIESRQRAEEQAREKRLLRYEELTRLANDFYCFSVLVGHYLDLTPDVVLARKREFESIVYATLPLWDKRFLSASNSLLGACFITNRGRGRRPLLTADLARHMEERGSEACRGWDEHFVDVDERKEWIGSRFPPGEGRRSYRKDIVMPAYAEFLAAASGVIGHDRDANDLLDMLRAPSVANDL